MIIVVVVRRAGMSKLREQGRVRIEADLAVLPIGHAFRTCVGRSTQDMVHQRRKRHLTLTDDHMVDEWKRPKIFQPHLSVEVGATEDDRHVRIQILDELRQGQAGYVLIERGGKSDDLVPPPIDAGHCPGQELRRRPHGHLLEERDRLAALP